MAQKSSVEVVEGVFDVYHNMMHQVALCKSPYKPNDIYAFILFTVANIRVSSSVILSS